MVQNWSLNDETAVKFFNILNILYHLGQTTDVHCRNRKKQNDKEHYEPVRTGSFLFHSAHQLCNDNAFLFEKISSSLPILLVCYLFMSKNLQIA